jgi:hypothetical protein
MLDLEFWGRSLAVWVLWISVWTVVVFVLARLLDAATRRFIGPRVRLLFYAAVVLRLALPIEFTTPVGLLGDSTPLAAEASSVPPVAVDRAYHDAASAALIGPPIEAPNLSAASTGEAASAVPPEPRSFPYGIAVLLIYGVGVLVCLGVWLIHGRRLAQLIAATKPIEVAHGIELREHALAGPFAHGLRRRVVVVPVGLRSRVQPELLDRLLAHERAHHEHGDPWVVALLLGVATIAWPVVPVWLTLRRVRGLLEQAADERALHGASDPQRRAYGRVLIELADGSTPIPALGAFAELESRIAALVRPVATPRALQFGLGLGLTIASVACMAPREDQRSEAVVADCDALNVRATTRHDDAERGHGSFEAAIAEYQIYLDQCQDHAEYADAAYGQLLSTMHAVGWSDDRPAPSCDGDCEGFPKLPYGADEQAVIDSWARYVAAVGRPLEGRAKDQLRMAKLFMQHNDFAAARPELEELVGQAEQEPALRAAEMLADLLTIAWIDQQLAPDEALRRGDELAAWLHEFQGAPFFERTDAVRLREATPTLLAGVEWKRAIADMAAGEAGDADGYRRCAERFEALAAAHPEHPKFDDLERNAATCRARVR